MLTGQYDAENPVQLSPADWQDVFLDQGRQVRLGEKMNGAWNVVVDRAGEYEITLRRWPVEADTPISQRLPPYRATDGEYPAGQALPITRARLIIADFDQSRAPAKPSTPTARPRVVLVGVMWLRYAAANQNIHGIAVDNP